jgi:predicted nucleic acid-binding protein
MLYAVDTNILLRSAEPNHPMHAETLAALSSLRTSGHSLCVFPQHVIEFWNVATRPAEKNGLGFSHQQAITEVEKIEKLFRLILDAPAIYGEWKHLVIARSVSGKQVHDTRIAATMTVHGITHLLTYNTGDFERLAAIHAVSPADCVPPSQPAQPPT